VVDGAQGGGAVRGRGGGVVSAGVTDSGYLSCADTAKLIRTNLKRAFPGVKFSVRSHTYAGGASIDVGWMDGPTEAAVKQITQGFESARFDGMIDMATYVTSWLEPDGSAHLAHDAGTEGSRGMSPERIGDPRSGGARMVHFGSHYVFTNRDLSDGWLEVLGEYVLENGRVRGSEQCRGCGSWMPDGLCFTAKDDRGWVVFVCSQRCGAKVMARGMCDTGDDHGPGCDGPLNCVCQP
jgi:hypothetical protein